MNESTKSKHVPLRTCVGCRTRDIQHHLVRIVRGPDALTLVVDARRKLPGRGAWLHPDPDCLNRATTRRAFNRSFRGTVDASTLERSVLTHEASASQMDRQVRQESSDSKASQEMTTDTP